MHYTLNGPRAVYTFNESCFSHQEEYSNQGFPQQSHHLLQVLNTTVEYSFPTDEFPRATFQVLRNKNNNPTILPLRVSWRTPTAFWSYSTSLISPRCLDPEVVAQKPFWKSEYFLSLKSDCSPTLSMIWILCFVMYVFYFEMLIFK